MANVLKNRKRLGVAIKTELLEELKELSAKTDIPQSKLVDRAIQDLLNKYKALEQG